jgi:hypothetical protein
VMCWSIMGHYVSGMGSAPVFVMSVCLSVSVRLHGTTGLPLHGFS